MSSLLATRCSHLICPLPLANISHLIHLSQEASFSFPWGSLFGSPSHGVHLSQWQYFPGTSLKVGAAPGPKRNHPPALPGAAIAIAAPTSSQPPAPSELPEQQTQPSSTVSPSFPCPTPSSSGLAHCFPASQTKVVRVGSSPSTGVQDLVNLWIFCKGLRRGNEASSSFQAEVCLFAQFGIGLD